MDALEIAIARAKVARQIPIYPKLKATPPAPIEPPLAPRVSSHQLPGVAPWREEISGRRAIAPRPAMISIMQVIRTIAAEFQVTPEQIRGNYRTRKFTFPRHVAQYLAQRVTRQSLPIIGRVFYRDHTSVLNGVRKITRMVDEDNTVRELVERLEKELRESAKAGENAI